MSKVPIFEPNRILDPIVERVVFACPVIPCMVYVVDIHMQNLEYQGGGKAGYHSTFRTRKHGLYRFLLGWGSGSDSIDQRVRGTCNGYRKASFQD